jgi:hypothetical protein
MEPQCFAWQISEFLHSANWVEEETSIVQRTGKGVLIECRTGNMGAAIGLQTALASVGIQAKASLLDDEKLPPLRIHVGLL